MSKKLFEIKTDFEYEHRMHMIRHMLVAFHIVAKCLAMCSE